MKAKEIIKFKMPERGNVEHSRSMSRLHDTVT